MSTFGTFFRVTTFGESHCKAVGCIIDGIPPRMGITEADIQPFLDRRRPGQSDLTTPRNEEDKVHIMSGTERGISLGSPICLMIHNKDHRPADYVHPVFTPRPSHADYTYAVKYGILAQSGGGRASARETAARVAAGAVADKWLKERYGCDIVAYVSRVGGVSVSEEEEKQLAMARWEWERANSEAEVEMQAKAQQTPANMETKAGNIAEIAGGDRNEASTTPCQAPTPMPSPATLPWLTRDWVDKSLVRCPLLSRSDAMTTAIRAAAQRGDSIGGTITCVVRNCPVGIGEPCFDRLGAVLAHAMMSIPATKGFTIGRGFDAVEMHGSQHNDMYMAHVGYQRDQCVCGDITTATNTNTNTNANATDTDTDTNSDVSEEKRERGGEGDESLHPVKRARTSLPTGDKCIDNSDNLVGNINNTNSLPPFPPSLCHRCSRSRICPRADFPPLLLTNTNNSRGQQGGISNGHTLTFTVAFKPVSTISQEQHTVTIDGAPSTLANRGRHDPCVVARAVAVVEAMAALVIADLAMQQEARATASDIYPYRGIA